MDNIATKLSRIENLKANKFLVELIFQHSIPNNITNLQVLEGDEQILHFLHCDNMFKYQVIDEGDHDEAICK